MDKTKLKKRFEKEFLDKDAHGKNKDAWKSFPVEPDKILQHLFKEIAKAVREEREGWVNYFKDKDLSRKAGEHMARKYLKRLKPKQGL